MKHVISIRQLINNLTVFFLNQICYVINEIFRLMKACFQKEPTLEILFCANSQGCTLWGAKPIIYIILINDIKIYEWIYLEISKWL